MEGGRVTRWVACQAESQARTEAVLLCGVSLMSLRSLVRVWVEVEVEFGWYILGWNFGVLVRGEVEVVWEEGS